MTSTIVGAVGLALIATASSPTFLAFYRTIQPSKHLAQDVRSLYEDGDGTASEKTQATFSTVRSRSLALIGSAIGFLVSIAGAVLTTAQPERSFFVESWLIFASWALLVVQALNLFLIHDPLDRYGQGVCGVVSSIILVFVIGVEHGFLGWRIPTDESGTAYIALTAVQLASAFLALISFATIQRRPELFRDGKPVDAQFTVSAFERYTFAWASSTLNFARKNKGLDLEDLPRVAEQTSANFLQQTFNNNKKRKRLWKAMAYQFRWAFVQQNVLIFIVGVTQFVPQFAMFNLLKLLEARQEGAQVSLVAWAWVFGLGLSMIITSWIEAWLYWIVWSNLGIPVRSVLSILVFMKATRRKDVKGVHKSKSEDPQASGDAIVNVSAGPRGEDTATDKKKKAGDEEDEDQQKSRQSTINLVGVDAKRVSDFTSYLYIFPGVAVKLLISMSFLYNLIGWKALLAGLATFALSLPFNIYVSKKYNAAQGDLMKLRDQKMAVVTEALQGIRQIKFSSFERQWQAKIGEKRSQELSTQRKIFQLDTCIISLWIFGPVMLSAVSLAVYAYFEGELSPSIAFTTIAVLSQIEVTLAILPELTTDAIDSWVSLNRIEEYLNAPEKVDCTTPASFIALENASVAWPSDSQEEDPDRFILRDINVRFPKNELSVISGKTGSGKSLLLAAILGEVDKIEGRILVPKLPSAYERHDHKATKGDWILDSAIAYVAQVPWIENATIKDNILFGLPLDSGRYKRVLKVCALEKDLEMLPDGELTDIGANGINLSGGQRWRMSFARALYSRAGILILDDIFSAVDAHVGRQLFDDALTGDLGVGRTRILVTHHVGLCLPKTKYTVVLGDGTVSHAGLVEDLKRTGSLESILDMERKVEEAEEAEIEDELKGKEADGDALAKVLSRRSERSTMIDDGGADKNSKAQPKKFTEDEKRETGSIKIDIYKNYLKLSGGLKLWLPLIALYTAFMFLILGRSYWVSIWTRSYKTESFFARPMPPHQQIMSYQQPRPYGPNFSQSLVETSSPDSSTWFYLGIYVALSVTVVVIGTLRYFFTFVASLRASKVMFEDLLYTVLRAPLRWLDTVPVGRVLNRFTADFNVLDSRISNDFGFFLYQWLEVVGIMVAGFLVSPFMIFFAVALLCVALFVALRYLNGAREVKRIESNAKSPVFEQFGSALAGVGTIRAFDKADEYINRMFTKIDNHSRAFWHLWIFNRWMGFRLNIIGAAFAIIVAGIIVFTRNIDASLAGFALAFALQYTGAVIWTLRLYANLEMDMNAAERIMEYSRIDTEDQGGDSPPAAWPTEGRLEVDGLVAGYAPDLPPVLKGLSFAVEKNQRVGVVGRTGAGKSSLTLALFRFLEAREGTVSVDGIDISKINLHDLRSRLAIIPQDPVLFSGTIRSNLDAFNGHSDAELRDALERVHLIRGTGLATRDDTPSGSGTATPNPAAAADTNINVFNSLTSKISEGGLNFSQGQRQLLCLARAIVSRPKIMVLDEATSAVDMATDVLIQRSIREEFGDSTLLVIAHRLSTIADFDKILVMSDGRAVEFDSPRKLWERQGVFWEMVGQSGEKERLMEIILGEGPGNGEGSSGGSGKSAEGSESGEGRASEGAR